MEMSLAPPFFLMSCMMLYFALESAAQEGCIAQTSNVVISWNESLNTSCSTVVYSNVTFTSSLPLMVILADWFSSLSSPSAYLTLSVTNSSLLNGSTLVVDAGNAADIPGGLLGVTITISGLYGSLGGIMFRGRFPANTSILVTDAVLRVATVPSFSFLFDSRNPQMGIAIGFLNFTLQGSSSVLLQRLTLNATVGKSDTAYPIYIGGPGGLFTVANSSYFVMSQLSMAVDPSLNVSFVSSSVLGVAGDIFIANKSVWSFTNSSIDLYGDAATFNATTTVTDGSTFSFTNTIITSERGLGFFFYNDITVNRQSQWYMMNMTIDTENDAFDHWAYQQVYNGSAMFYENCVMKSRSPWETGSACAFETFQVALIGETSQWYMRDVLIHGDHVRGSLWNCGFAVQSYMALAKGATAFWERCNISSFDSIGMYLTFYLSGGSRAFITNSQVRSSSEPIAMTSSTIEGHSLLTFANLSLIRVDAPNSGSLEPGVFRISSDLNVTNHSLVLLTSNIITTIESNASSEAHVTGITCQRLIIMGFSSVRIAANSSIFSPFSTGMNFTDVILVADFSSLQMTSLAIVTPRGSPFLTLQSLTIRNSSAFIVQDVNMTGVQGMRLNNVGVSGSSWMLLQRIRWSTASFSACLLFTGAALSLDSSPFNTLSLLELNCNSTGILPFYGFPTAVPAGALYVRCIVLNGMPSSTTFWPSGYAALACGQCFAASDCFHQLVQLPIPLSITCGEPCKCNNTAVLTDGPLCLPDTGAVAPPIPSVPPATTTTFIPTTFVPMTTAVPPTSYVKPHSPTTVVSLSRSSRLSVTKSSPTLTQTDVLESSASVSDTYRPSAGSLTCSSTVSDATTETGSFTKNVPVAPAASIVASAVFISAVSIASASVLPASAFAVQRTMLIGSLAQCSFSFDAALDLATSPTTLQIGDGDNEFLRGGVVGNWLLWAGCVAFAAAGTKAMAVLSNKPWMKSWESLSLPGNFIAPFSFLLQPTVMCGVAIVVHSTGLGDIMLGGVSLLATAAICMTVTAYMLVWFGSKSVRLPAAPRDRHLVASVLSYLFEAETRWIDTIPRFTARLGKVFESNRGGAQWFAAYELWYAVAGGIIAGVMPNGDAACNILLVATTCLAALYVLLLGAVRPYASRVDAAVTMINGLLNLAASVEALANVDNDAVSVTNTVAQYVALASVALIILQAMLLYLVEARVPMALQRLARLWSQPVPLVFHEMTTRQHVLGKEKMGQNKQQLAQLAPTELRDVLSSLKILIGRVAAMSADRQLLTSGEVRWRLELLVRVITNSRAGRRLPHDEHSA